MGSLTILVYLGCYTNAENPNGLKTIELDAGSGEMRIVDEKPVKSAIYQSLSPDGSILYSCTDGGLASFKLEKDGSIAEKIDEIALGNCVCHVAAMPDGNRVVFADYTGGFAGSAETSGGRFGKAVIHRHEGSGPNIPRQSSAHCHQALPTPDGMGYCVVDLGLDEIVVYPEGKVFKTSPAGGGPRHIVFHPDGRHAFLASELGNLVSSLSWSPDGGFSPVYTLQTRENPDPANIANADNGNLAAAIRMSPDAKQVLVSNRGENSIVAYDFDETAGRLSFKARTRLKGDWPRDFAFVHGNLALAAMERSGEVHSMRYDGNTGTFERIATIGGLHRPVAILPFRRR